MLKLGKVSRGRQEIWQIVPSAEEPVAPQWTKEGGYGLGQAAYLLAQKQALSAQLRAKPSLNNLKALGLGTLQFVQDWNEHFAFVPQYAGEALMPDLESSAVFLVPESRESYSFNGYLSDKVLAQINEPARTVLFYEGADEKPTFRYDGKAAIGFADGSAKLVSLEESKTLIWGP